MGLYKRGDVWYARYFFKGQCIRKAIGKNKKKAEAELEAIRTDIRGGRYKEPRRDPFETLVDDYEKGRKELAWYRSERNYIKRTREYFKGRIVQDIGVRMWRNSGTTSRHSCSRTQNGSVEPGTSITT